MNTDWDTRRGIEERGTITSAELRDLIEDTDEGEIASALLEGLKEALKVQLGILVINTSTDDDDGEYTFNLVKVESDEDPSVLVS